VAPILTQALAGLQHLTAAPGAASTHAGAPPEPVAPWL
jgi:hypothetical protein